MWHIFLILSALSVVAGIVYLIVGIRKNNFKFAPVNVILCAVFVANTFMFIPIYSGFFASDSVFLMVFKTFLISLHHAIRLFVVDSDFEIIKEMVPKADFWLHFIYTAYMAILYLLSPIMTFGFIFSFFKNLSAHRRYITNYNKDVYIFSGFNEESIELALSIKEKYKDCAIVFTDYSDENTVNHNLKERAKSINSIIFEKDILSLNFMFHSKSRSINFLLVGDNEQDNVKNGLGIIKAYNGRENTRLYVLSNEIEGELLLNSVDRGKIKVRRVSNVRIMIYNILQNQGERLFSEATYNPSTGQKDISAVIVGLGRYGAEMTRSLAWFCQMDGYRIEIDSFESDESVAESFKSSCPELMDDAHNDKFDDIGESQYRISLHSPVNINSVDFNNQIKKLTKTTYVFIDLGDDESNIRASIKLRMLFEQIGIKPIIQAVVENSERKNALSGIKNYSGQEYSIEYVGATCDIFTFGNIINSELEREALSRHLCWGEEEDFWRYEYNYRSSMASALHKRMKKLCKIPGIEKAPADRTEEERWNLRKMEHRRWDAYMRSEGFIYAPVRNNLAKAHHCLVTFDKLTEKEQAKDDD